MTQSSNDPEGKGGALKPPVWDREMLFAQFHKRIKVWKLGTQAPKKTWAATVAFQSLKGTRHDMALDWLANNEVAATRDDGLDRLLEYLQKHIEGTQRDVRLGLINDLFKYKRGDSVPVQSFLLKMDEAISRLRATGLELNPNTHRDIGDYIETNDEGALECKGDVTVEMLAERLEECDRYEKAWQEIMFTLVYYNSRLTSNDQKMLLNTIDEDEMTYDRLCKEIRRLYPVQSEGANKGKRHGAFLTRKDAQSEDEIEWTSEEDRDSQSEVSAESQDEDDSDPSGFNMAPKAYASVCNEEGFMSKYKVRFDNRKGQFRVKPRKVPKRGQARMGQTNSGKHKNPIDRKTGEYYKCFVPGCGSKDHLADKCTHPNAKKAKARFEKKRKDKGKKKAFKASPASSSSESGDEPETSK